MRIDPKFNMAITMTYNKMRSNLEIYLFKKEQTICKIVFYK